MKKYEISLIIKSLNSDEEINNVIKKIELIIQDNGGEISKIDKWGKRRMAYLIKDCEEGYYVVIYFIAESKVVFELNRVIKITDEILRHMIIKKDE